MHLDEAWAALVDSPALGVALTLAAYRISLWLRARSGNHPLVNPVLISIALLGAALWVLDIDYAQYLTGGQLISLLLGPATVALAWPMHKELALVKQAAVPILGGVAIGSGVAVVTAIAVTRLLGGAEDLVLSMAPKSTTTPVALALSETIEGVPALTAVLTILTGITGAVAGPRVLTWLRVRDPRVRGLAVGVSSHGIGTAQMLQESRTEGAFSGLAMALTALGTSLWIPLLVPLLT